jgi:hypothetical protein
VENLYKETGKNRQKTEEALELLAKLLKNIVDNPSEEKYRVFRKVNCQKIMKCMMLMYDI